MRKLRETLIRALGGFTVRDIHDIYRTGRCDERRIIENETKCLTN